MIILSFLGILFGFAVIWFSSEWTVKYAGRLALAMGVSPFFIGIFLLGIATSLPELAVALTALLRGATDVSVGNVIGANLTDLALVPGIPALIVGSLVVANSDRFKLLFMLLMSLVVMCSVLAVGVITPWMGIIILGGYGFLMWMLWDEHPEKMIENDGDKENSVLVALKLCVSVALVIIASAVSVSLAVKISEATTIGLGVLGSTLFAIGTTLPEIAINITAVRKGEHGIAWGNALGSAVANCTVVLGVLSIFSKVPVDLTDFRPTIIFVFAIHALLGLMVFRSKKITRAGAFVLLGLFVAYIGSQFVIG
ncbi:sodium:calcium antiporter [bacterium]|nr:sodium:calcium antiporter [bacterium]